MGIQERVDCNKERACCFDGSFTVTQKNSDQQESIHITEFVGKTNDLNQPKCVLYEGDSSTADGESIYFPLEGEGDAVKNKGDFIVYGDRFTALKSGSFMEFEGDNSRGVRSVGRCEAGDCLPKTMDMTRLLSMFLAELVVIVGLLVLWFIKRSINTDKAKNQALATAKKAEAGSGDMNDMVGKKMERAMQMAAARKSASRKSIQRKASADDMSLLSDENFDSFEGVDLCGMQKLQKIDKRNPQDRKILQAFNKADTDGSGFIDSEELLRALIETTGKPWTMTQINEIMEEFDEDGNGELGVEEFKLLVNSTAGGTLNFNRNRYAPDDYNAPYEPPTLEAAEEFSRQDLPKCAPGTGEQVWAKEPCITRILFGDKKKELMPIISTDIDDCDFGVGISLYFKNLLFMAYMLFGASLLALPISITYNQSSNLAWQLQGSYVDSENLSIGAGITDLGICALLTLFLVLADEKEKKLIAKIDAGVQTPADYTLVLKNAPPLNEVSLGEWRKYFEDITKGMVRRKDDYVPEERDLVEDESVEDGKVVSITYCVKGARTMYTLVKQRRALEDKLYFKVRALKKKNPDYKLPVATSLDPPTFMQKILCSGSIPPAFMLSEINDLDKKINNLQMSNKMPGGSRMFVTFDTEIALDTACVETYNKKGPHGKYPKVKQACEASDLIYANMAVGIWHRRVREYLGYILCFGAIAGSLQFLLYVDSLRLNPTIGGFFIAGSNAFLKVFCEMWVKSVERPLTYSDQQFSLMTKLTAAHVLNTAVLLLFTCEALDLYPHVFSTADANRSGSLDKEEAISAMMETTSGISWTTGRMTEEFNEFDANGDGELQQAEFQLLLTKYTSKTYTWIGQGLYTNTEFVAKVQSTILADISASIVRVVDGGRLAKRVLARIATPATQTQVNNLYMPTKWNLAERYSDSIKTLFMCLFYVSILPTGLLYATVAFAIAYLSDKYCILRTWEKPPEFDYKMSVTARYILEWTLCAHVGITWVLYTQWPFVEIQTKMELVHTPEQQTLVALYLFAFLGSGVFFGIKQFGNVLTSLITDSVGEQRYRQVVQVPQAPRAEVPR